MGKGGVFFDWMLNILISERKIGMFDNVYFSPTPLSFLTEMICRLILNFDEYSKETIHISGELRLSRYQFGCMISEILGNGVEVYPEKKPEDSTFLHDLSIVSSDIINMWREKKFKDYIKDEILNATFCE